MIGKAGVHCYYCGNPLRYEGGGFAVGGDVVPAQGVPIYSYDYHLIVTVAGPEDKWEEYFDSYAQAAGFTQAKNPAGMIAFQAFRTQQSQGAKP
jgi:hypothetical protein